MCIDEILIKYKYTTILILHEREQNNTYVMTSYGAKYNTKPNVPVF